MSFALVMVEKYAGRAVHLRDNHPFRAIDHKGAIAGHQRHVAHIDVLLLDILDRFRSGILVDIKYNQPQPHFQRRSEGDAALTALLNVIFRSFKFILNKFQKRSAGKVGNRENRFENRLQAFLRPLARQFVSLKKLIIRGLLDLNQVRHACHFSNGTKKFANLFATGICLSHLAPHVVLKTYVVSDICSKIPLDHAAARAFKTSVAPAQNSALRNCAPETRKSALQKSAFNRSSPGRFWRPGLKDLFEPI